MKMRVDITLLRGVLVLILSGAVATQVIALPLAAGTARDRFPEEEPWVWVALGLAVVWLLCAEVVLVSVWKLLTAVRTSQIFDDRALRWVDLMVAAFGAATIVSATALVLAVVSGLGPISVPAGALLLLLATGAGLLLMVVLRELLQQATTLTVELEAVV